MIPFLRNTTLICGGTCLFLSTQAQDKSFNSWGWTAYLDYMQGAPNENGLRQAGISFITALYTYRYNLAEPNVNTSFSISATPAFGGFAGDGGYLHFNLPIVFGIETGAGSTYESEKNGGTFFRIGYEFTAAPLLSEIDTDASTTWGALSLQTGVRYYNGRDRLKEINVKAAFGIGNESLRASGIESLGAFGLRISFVRFIGFG